MIFVVLLIFENITKNREGKYMENVFLSIIIPAYNSEKYIAECLQSVIDQELNDNLYEIIIVNDGSTDKTVDVINRFVKLYSNVYLYSKDNSGVSSTRNYGVTMSKGKYLWFIDSDDYISKNILKQIIDKLNSGNYEVMQICEKLVDSNAICKNESIKLCFDDNKQIDGHLSVSYIISKQFLLTHNLFFNENMDMHEDALWCLFILILAKKSTVLLNKVYFYRQHRESTMKNRTKSFYEKHSRSLVQEAKILRDIYNKGTIETNPIDKNNFHERIRECIQGALFDVMMSEKNHIKRKEFINQLKESDFYPYPFIWQNLEWKGGIKRFFMDILTFFYPVEIYYMCISSLYWRLKR